MITEDYISFETAKLLKERGFNKDTYTMSMYDENGEAKDVLLLKEGEEPVLRPTLQMAMKWLREKYGLYVVIRPYVTEEGTFSLFDIKSIKEKGIVVNLKTKTGFTTYEEAAEAAIKYCFFKED